MGCHTWFYKKVDISYEHAKDWLVTTLKKEIETDINIINQGASLADMFKVYSEWTPEYGQRCLNVHSRQLRMVENGLCKEAVMNSYSPNFDIYEWVSDKGMYKEVEDFHDVFRIGGYPDDRLFSLKETLKYLENKKDKITYLWGKFNERSKEEEAKEYTIKRLREFWEKYPDGMINFG